MGRTASPRPARRAGKPGAAVPVDFGPLADWVGFHLRMAQAASFQAFAREAKDVELSPGRFATLTLIAQNPGISQTALSRANGRDKSSLTPVLDDLVRRALVRRTRAQTDRRSYQLTLTAAGKRMLRRLTACAQRHENHLDRVLGRDRASFLRVLRRVAAEL